MPTDCVSFKNSSYSTEIIKDYLDQKDNLTPLYNRFPLIENFEMQIEEKILNFNFKGNSQRKILSAVLEKQYSNIASSEATLLNIKLLKDSKTFTITTGHQLNLFTGPLYFLYKIISTINLTKDLKTKYPTYNFVPVYWMATEDHDFEEINYFNYKGKKFRWDTISSGPVGRLSTKGLESVFEIFSKELNEGNNAKEIKKLFEESYLNHTNLADATRFLAHSLFGKYGLVVLDADDSDLKKFFIPYIKEELLNQTSHQFVSETIKALKKYKIQVNPREINLFYISDDLRERIILKDGVYKINNTSMEFSETQMLLELENCPEKFSPNVITRPLYQEVILPNLCYIGGGGEIAYWLELKSYFDNVGVTFPILLLRNSVLLTTEKQAKKADKLNLNWTDLFLKQENLINKVTQLLSEIPIDFGKQKMFLEQQFKLLFEIALQTDLSFTGAVKAQQAKQTKGLDHLEKRLLKAQKRKFASVLERITDLQNELFPHQALQERQANFSEFYLENGSLLIEKLFEKLKPLDHKFNVLVI